jgi:hypothetical protein
MAWLCPRRGTERRYTISKMPRLLQAAALAVWLRMRRIWRLPFGDRWLWFTPALSSSPGQAPIHEASCCPDGKVAAVGPTSAMICHAESTPRPGTSASRLDSILVRMEQSGYLLVQLTDLLLEELQLLQCHPQEPSVHGFQVCVSYLSGRNCPSGQVISWLWPYRSERAKYRKATHTSV